MFRPLATSALALIAGAAPLLAEVTPAQVWDNLSAYYADMGYEVTTGGRDEAGDTLSLTDIAITTDSASGEFSIAIPRMVLQQTGDAKVRTTVEGPVIAHAAGDPADEDRVSAHAEITLPDNEILSSGSAEDMFHQIAYPAVAIAARVGVAEPEAPAEAEAEAMPVTITLTNIAGEYRSRAGTPSETTYDMTVEAIGVELAETETGSGDEGEGAGRIAATGRAEGLTMTGRLAVPSTGFKIAENPHEALRAGLVIEASMTMGPITGNASFTGADVEGATQAGSASFAADSGELKVGMAQAGLSYSGSAKGARTEMTSDELPFPVSYAIEAVSGALLLPIAKADEAQPYSFNYVLTGLTLADGLWDMFDPEGKLPRDPASLTVDLEGMARVTDDLLDPAFAQRMEARAHAGDAAGAETEAQDPGSSDGGDATADLPSPFRPETVRINRFALGAVGARADVTGDLTFPEGADQPVGTVEGSFDGVNALLDSLVATGFVPPDQVMGARMMIAMFARPAEDNPEQLRTTLELREDGAIFANGQQVK